MQPSSPSERLDAVDGRPFVVLGGFPCPAEAWSAAEDLVDAAVDGEGPLATIGEFVLPPPGGPPSRNFQTPHLDFEVPLTAVAPADVARFTALHIPAAPARAMP